MLSSLRSISPFGLPARIGLFACASALVGGCAALPQEAAQPEIVISGAGDEDVAQAGAIAAATPTLSGYPARIVPPAEQTANVEAARGAPYPAPVQAATAESEAAYLQEAIEMRDLDTMAWMLERMVTVHLPGGGSDELFIGGEFTPKQMEDLWPLPASAAPRFEPRMPKGLAITETLRGRVDPELEVKKALFSRGWGEDGTGEMVLVLMSDPGGSWIRPRARIFAQDGFAAALSTTEPATRTVHLWEIDAPAKVSIDLPSGWHRGEGGRIESDAPWSDEQADEELVPRASLRFGDGRDASLQMLTGPPGFRDESPLSHVTETLTLETGEEAILARSIYEDAQYTRLVVELLSGERLVAWCEHWELDCETPLRSLRVLSAVE